MSIYDFKVKDVTGETISLDVYKGKTLLIINSATHCRFTPQYPELQVLYKKYKEQGFEILDFPCNQFGNEAPGTNEEIAEFCKERYGLTFKLFDKINVNGPNESSLFTWLKAQKGGLLGSAIKWNFTKFLVSKDGQVVSRYAPLTKPSSFEKDIVEQLEK